MIISGLKKDDNKLKWDLLPMEEIEDIIRVLMFGEKKYQAWNWQKVDDGEKRYLNAAYRHMASIQKKEALDEETNLSHYSHALCSLLFAFWHSRNK